MPRRAVGRKKPSPMTRVPLTARPSWDAAGRAPLLTGRPREDWDPHAAVQLSRGSNRGSHATISGRSSPDVLGRHRTSGTRKSFRCLWKPDLPGLPRTPLDPRHRPVGGCSSRLRRAGVSCRSAARVRSRSAPPTLTPSKHRHREYSPESDSARGSNGGAEPRAIGSLRSRTANPPNPGSGHGTYTPWRIPALAC
jgi:hypothetical protein